ncbi:MAG: hypothetical protein KGV59_07450 [Tenacibaculum sp.]|nr:hypothetical protein [Tenacibaculum sp.]
MKKTILTIVVLVLAIVVGRTQKKEDLFYAGYTYSQKADGSQDMIPFAMVKICEAENPESVIAVKITGLNGLYVVRNIDVEKSYIVKVTAPNIEEQQFQINPNNGRVKKYNISTNIELKVPTNYNTLNIVPKSFELSVFEENTSLDEMISKLPMITIEDEEFLTNNGGTVKLWFNGAETTQDIYNKLKNYPASKIVKQVEYFDLSNIKDAVFDGILNINLKVGKGIAKPDYTLRSLRRLDK